MKTPSIGFIGGGRITRILLQAFANKKINLVQATVFDINPEATAKLKDRFPDIHVGTLEEAASKAIVIICLHPPAILETLEKIAPMVTRSTVLGSLAPKINSEKNSGKTSSDKQIGSDDSQCNIYHQRRIQSDLV
jgi:pyrroline-5-carboxylate reductase